MAAPLTINRLTVPLFSSDYAKVNREIAEWNRRARAASLTLDQQIEALQSQIDSLSVEIDAAPTGIATAASFGTVKTNQTSVNPVVYLKTTVDGLIAALQAQIDALDVRLLVVEATTATLTSNQTPQRGNGPPDASVVARYDGDEYWDMDGGPGTYRWYAATSEWLSV